MRVRSRNGVTSHRRRSRFAAGSGLAMPGAIDPQRRDGAGRVALALAIACCMLVPAAANAHTPLCSCYDNGDGTILCEGGFSDGATAAGVRLVVLDRSGNVLIEGTMSEQSEFVFTKPSGAFTVLFDGGAGHQIRLPGTDIH
ncbi:hypothetical protein RA307_03540 [Xanthobacteraceae bacterium Astr-EGSB]|uniref:hypothetical protein n=1 Tax=Astrobacterium formosum TaxID=3069710 RepID=UPI0027B67555|nr:hypothetical protein [Xanthobacteraceae bacterium Astr-EGSB]